jgi:hypothetical protein
MVVESFAADGTINRASMPSASANMSINSIEWSGSLLEVRARAIPRFLWMTVSIDVLLDGEPVLRTGGQLKSAGTVSQQVLYQGTYRNFELSWSNVQSGGFPYVLRIDSERVLSSTVAVENMWFVLLLWLGLPLIAAFATWLYHF